jgi:hypothetical protein
MYSIVLSITAADPNDQAFQKEAAAFITNLRSVRDLEATVPEKAVPGTRGFLEVLSQIVVTGITIGAFTAIYTFAKDLYDRVATAEVELKFADGSTLKLKGLSYSQAQEQMRLHLEKNKSERSIQ